MNGVKFAIGTFLFKETKCNRPLLSLSSLSLNLYGI